MLYREIIAVCSEIHTKHINTPCGQNVELLNVKLAVHTVTTVRYIQWPLYGTYSDHCTVHVVNTMPEKLNISASWNKQSRLNFGAVCFADKHWRSLRYDETFIASTR